MNFDLTPLYWTAYAPNQVTCWDFVCMAWKHITGRDLRVVTGPACGEGTQLRMLFRHKDKLLPLDRKKPLCLVFMRNRATQLPHAGVFVKGSILHLDIQGVLAQDLGTLRALYHEVSFFDVPADYR